uniref:Ribonuclease E n=1 Tax=Chroomonas placoidea TaxID=173977 RepID=A0A222AI50_9CRYP|nr:ribonuclease E [Chroomonas placoidea]ASO76051.1 ribonuclease E [Chroomonas placoidea]
MRIHHNHIVISEKNQLSALYSESILKGLKTYNTPYHVGDIYFGKLESGLANINAAFINLRAEEKNGFIQLNKLLPARLKRANQIKVENLKFNETILVQVTKELTGSKGPSLTTNLGLNGEYVILLPFGEGVNASNKIYNFIEKQYLRAFVTLLKPLGVGMLIKKEASGINGSSLREDVLKLVDQWYQLQSKIKPSLKPYLVSDEVNFIKDTLKIFYTDKTEEISIDSFQGAWKVCKRLISTKKKQRKLALKIRHYPNFKYFIKYFNLDLAIYYLVQSTVILNTGGSVVIEKTEALTAIDINSGSFNTLKDSRASLLWINCEAATEISIQLQLRNIGGIIVIDFIDMAHQKDQMKLLNHLNFVLQADQGDTKIIQLSEIGLIELTRKREGQNIYDAFSYNCYKCSGLGYQVHFDSIYNRNASIKVTDNYHIYMNDFV